MKVEVEGKELILRNSNGDMVVIPKNKRSWVIDRINNGCDSCIDKLVSTLPTLNDYAEDGTVIPRYDVYSIAPRQGYRRNQDGTISTHKMAYIEMDGKYIAYPTLFQNGNDWVELNDDDNWAAFEEAKKRGELFEFNDEKLASDFAGGSWKNPNNTPATYDPVIGQFVLPEVNVSGADPRTMLDKMVWENSNLGQKIQLMQGLKGGDLTTEDYREYGKKHQNPRRLQEIQEQYKDRTRDWYIENIVHPSQRPDKRFNDVARNERIDRAYSKYMRNLYGEELFKRAGLQGGSYEENLMQANSFTPEELEYMQNIRGFSPYMSAMNKNRSIRVRENPNDPTMYYLHAQQNNKEQ